MSRECKSDESYYESLRLLSLIAKKNSQPEKQSQFGCSPSWRQLWCWAPQWRYDLRTLMKWVCKVLIYHLPKTQHFIMIYCCCNRPWTWMLLGSAPHKSENTNTQEWLILPPFVVSGLVIIHFINDNWRIGVIKPFQCLYPSIFFLLEIDLHLCFAHRQRISAVCITCFTVDG